MLSQLQTQEVIKVTYDDVAPATPKILTFPTNEPYEVVAVTSRITSVGAIVLPGMAFRDQFGTIISGVSIIPWQFANTTIETTTGQTPDPSIAALFGPNIGGFIFSGLHVFNGWSITWSDFLATPGVIFEGEILFTLARSHD